MSDEVRPVSPRRLTYGYLRLPHLTRIQIANSLQLLTEDDKKLPDSKQYEVVFVRAKERGLLQQLWQAVEIATASMGNEAKAEIGEVVGSPERRHVVAIKLQADSWEDVLRTLDHISFELHTHDPGTIRIISGGYNSGYVVVDQLNPSQTHDSYFDEIDAWLERREAEGNKSDREASND